MAVTFAAEIGVKLLSSLAPDTDGVSSLEDEIFGSIIASLTNIGFDLANAELGTSKVKPSENIVDPGELAKLVDVRLSRRPPDGRLGGRSAAYEEAKPAKVAFAGVF